MSSAWRRSPTRERDVKRVAIQLISTGGFYGAERALIELGTYLAGQGWESHVVALEGQGAPELVRRAREAGLSATAFSDGSRLSVTKLLGRLRSALASHPRAIVHSHGYKPDILLAALRAPRRFGCIATCHTWYSDTMKMRLFERLDKRVLRGFDHVVAVSDEIRADLVANGVSPGNVSQIDNGISAPDRDPEARASVRSEFGIAPEAPLVVQIGRLAKSKRNDLLLDAVARLPGAVPVNVLLVGEGEQRQALEEKARSLGIDARVIFCGFRSDAHRLIAAADVLALTSNKEGLPIVLLEAMAIGCPIVSTPVGAVPTILHSGENAWLVQVDDLEALTRALGEALGNRAHAQAMADTAKRAFHARFTRDVMGRRYLDLYDRMHLARGWH